MKKGSVFTAYLLVSIATFFWGLSLIWTDMIIDMHVPVFVFTFMRMCLAGIIMLIASGVTGKLQKIEKGDLKWFLLMVFSEPFLFFIGESFGLKYTGSPTLVATIVATIPVFVMILGYLFFKETLSLVNRSGVLITLTGVIMFVLLGGEVLHTDYYYGLAIIMIAVIGSCGYTLVCKKLTSKYTPFTITTYQFAFAIPFFAVTFIIWGLPEWKPEFLSFQVLRPIICLAVLCSCLCFGLYSNAIDKIGMTKASIFTAIIPVVSAIFAYFMGRDSFTFLQIVGMAITLVGVVLSQYKPLQR